MTTTSEALRRIGEYEAGVSSNAFTQALRVIGRTRIFALIYGFIGPYVDRWVMRRPALARLYGLPCLLLTTTGARSGLARTSPLLYVRHEGDFVLVGTNFGKSHHPAWSANLLANPGAQVEIAGEKLAVTARLADPREWEALFARFVSLYPGYQDYLMRCGDRQPRLFLLRPAPANDGG